MDDSRLVNLTQLKNFLEGTQEVDLSLVDAPTAEKYRFILETVRRLNYKSLGKRDKGIVLAYIAKVCGHHHAQLHRLVSRTLKENRLERKVYKRTSAHRIYTTGDIKLLEKTDELHLRLSEKATGEILRREFLVYGKDRYANIANISHGHISNLRKSENYRSFWVNHTKTRQIPIGTTAPPENFGKPGSIRIDSVSQKDVYHINTVDEICQWEIVFCVPQLSQSCMLPALDEIFGQYPFVIFNFHSDRGRETINYVVADLLQRLLIKQTKSRSYHSGDNALVESKNGAVIRKNMGWFHINQNLCDEINKYYTNFFNPYLNFHRPCGFATKTTDHKGRAKKVYDVYRTPYDALKTITGARQFLVPGITFEKLEKIAMEYSDNDYATILREEERKLFQKIEKANNKNGSLIKT